MKNRRRKRELPMINGGGLISLKQKEHYLIRDEWTFSERNEGRTVYINDRQCIRRYIIKSNVDNSVMQCSKATKKLCTQYQETHGAKKYGKYNNIWLSEDYLYKYLKKIKGTNEKPEIAYVDVDHCYWQIAYVHGILDDKTYEKYKNNRIARLTSIGCRNRSTYTDYFKNGRHIKREVEPNELAWVWHFVNYKAFQAMETVKKEFPIFSYYTDGVYLPEEHAQEAVDLILSKHKLHSKIERYSIIGYTGHYLILQNKETKRYKQTRLSRDSRAKELLPKLEYSPFKKKNEAMDRKKAAKDIARLKAKYTRKEITRLEYSAQVKEIKEGLNLKWPKLGRQK